MLQPFKMFIHKTAAWNSRTQKPIFLGHLTRVLQLITNFNLNLEIFSLASRIITVHWDCQEFLCTCHVDRRVNLSNVSTTSTDNIFKYFFFTYYFWVKMRLNISCELFAQQTIHFMWIVCIANDSHLMSSFTFSENSEKKMTIFCYNSVWHFKD